MQDRHGVTGESEFLERTENLLVMNPDFLRKPFPVARKRTSDRRKRSPLPISSKIHAFERFVD